MGSTQIGGRPPHPVIGCALPASQPVTKSTEPAVKPPQAVNVSVQSSTNFLRASKSPQSSVVQ